MVKFIVDGIQFNCAEMFMMYRKALLFNDLDTAKKILQEYHPREHQRLGRLVKNYDQAIWDANKYQIVYEGNYNKFKQNKEDLKWLLDTGDTLLVESSPVDCVWGVGLDMKDPLIQDEKNWRGQNLLGKVLTEVRDTLRKELQNDKIN
jgi:ribA/ribD-fused uncharacterized protein